MTALMAKLDAQNKAQEAVLMSSMELQAEGMSMPEMRDKISELQELTNQLRIQLKQKVCGARPFALETDKPVPAFFKKKT